MFPCIFWDWASIPQKPRDTLGEETAFRRALECMVRAGEMLYLPSAWWHEVTSEGDAGRSLSLNFWFRAEWPRGTLRHLTAEAAALRPPLRASAYRQLGTELA